MPAKEWLTEADLPEEPKRYAIGDDPSQPGSDDLARMLSVSAFNGVCGIVRVLGRAGILSSNNLDRIHESMTAPLDNPELRDDEIIADYRDAIVEVLATARALQG